MAKYKLKFRAWDGKQMHRVGVLHWSFRDGITTVHADLRPWKSGDPWAPIEDPRVMQFSGFKDAKGKEVYEGDLLAWPDWHEHRENDPMPVVFEYGGFWADGSGLWDYAKYIKKGSNKYTDPTYELEELEVVGNTYEGDLR